MDELLEWMDYIEDKRQQTKVRHKLKDIIVIVLFATLANVDDWVEMEYFAHYHEAYLKKYIELKNGIPSHDTLCRVFGMLSPEILQQLYGKWQELLNQNEGEVLRKLICIDGKTMRSNKRKEGKPNHIITAWSKEDGFSLGQKVVNTKSNEITGNTGITGENPDQRSGCDDRCHGNADSHSREDPFKTRRLCTGVKGKPEDAA